MYMLRSVLVVVCLECCTETPMSSVFRAMSMPFKPSRLQDELRKRLPVGCTAGTALMSQLLQLDPSSRLTASEAVMVRPATFGQLTVLAYSMLSTCAERCGLQHPFFWRERPIMSFAHEVTEAYSDANGVRL